MSAVVDRPTREDPTDTLRSRIAELNGDLAILEGHIVRCHDEAAKLVNVQAAHTAAGAEVERLYAARAAGESVTQAKIDEAEAALSIAAAALGRAERAAQGSRLAAAKYASEAATVQAQIASRRVEFKPLLAQVLIDRAREAMAQHRLDVETFARRQQVTHHATILAVSQVAKAHGITGMPFTFPNQHGRLLQVPTTPTHDKYMDVFCAVELGEDIDAQARRIAAELEALLA